MTSNYSQVILAAAIHDTVSNTPLPEDRLTQVKQDITHHCLELLNSKLLGLTKRLDAKAQAERQEAARVREAKELAEKEAAEQLRLQQEQEEQRRLEQQQGAEQQRRIAEYRVLMLDAKARALQVFDRDGLFKELAECGDYFKAKEVIDVSAGMCVWISVVAASWLAALRKQIICIVCVWLIYVTLASLLQTPSLHSGFHLH